MRIVTYPKLKSSISLAILMILVHVQQLVDAAEITYPEITYPEKSWLKATAADVGMDVSLLHAAREYALSAGGSGYITRHGKLVLSWGDAAKKYDLKSSSKSIGVTALGLAIGDGKIHLDDIAKAHQASIGIPPQKNQSTGWLDEITIRHLATQTAGFAKRGGYEPLLFRPGSKWHYSDGGPNWLAECVTLAYQQDIQSLLFERVFTPTGITKEDLSWRRHAYRPREIKGIPRFEFGSGVHANVNAMARIGYLYLRKGKWKDKQLVSQDFIEQARNPIVGVVGLPEHDTPHGNASDHYGLLWWNNADGTLKNVPRDAYWSWGLYDSLIIVIPSLDIVVSRTGKSWKREEGEIHYDVLKPFLEPIVASIGQKYQDSIVTLSGYPQSKLITSIEWAPVSTIIREAKGSDNWPITWGDDDAQYSAYGDGWGFDPKVEKKLSMGLVRIVGNAKRFQGQNLRSKSGETVGQGKHGKKASGILMIDGTLYLLVRNAGHSQIAYSTDRGKNWRWSDWKFETSMGFPSFLNFGRNYAGARDDYVYIYSPDSETAYESSDHLIMARVPKEDILERTAYEFFTSQQRNNETNWNSKIEERRPVFENSLRCYRTNVTYNSGLKRYLLCQVFPQSQHSQGPRFQGGFGIYDAPEPWGPWSVVFETENWDVGPGESNSFPTKWMSEDGRTVHLVFSGDDHFSVRKATLTISTPK